MRMQEGVKRWSLFESLCTMISDESRETFAISYSQLGLEPAPFVQESMKLVCILKRELLDLVLTLKSECHRHI